jgi:hypothetical protein
MTGYSETRLQHNELLNKLTVTVIHTALKELSGSAGVGLWGSPYEQMQIPQLVLLLPLS